MNQQIPVHSTTGHFTSASDVSDIDTLVREAMHMKAESVSSDIGKGKTLGLLFLNPSLRTRMSLQVAAQNLGMHSIVMDINKDGWKLEFEEGSVMNGSTQEHVKDAANVLSQYCDILGIRTFAQLNNRERDYSETILNSFKQYARVPVISMESATLHPLQSLADLVTIAELNLSQPRIAVSWTPHPRPLPQAVVNSFLEWTQAANMNVVLAHPKGYELPDRFTRDIFITHNQAEALRGADVVYAKSWCSYSHYGTMPPVEDNWTITSNKMDLTDGGTFMHCLPIRRNVVAEDSVIDDSLVYDQADNRTYAAQAVLKQILEGRL